MKIKFHGSAIERFHNSTMIVLLFVFLCNNAVVGQRDSLPPASMTSEKLVTIDDFRPDAVYGKSYMQMMNSVVNKEKKRTIFNRKGSKFILPTLFIAYGTAARFNQLPIRQFDFDIDHEIKKRVHGTNNIDTYFEYGMPVLAYGLGFIPGIEAKNNFRDRTFAMATSTLIMKGSVELLKHTTPIQRPYGDRRSFPSGHTAVAMMSAHIMYKEYKDVSPWICVGGYLIASTTGVLRITNRAHWLSDVVMGAGIGILSAEIGYMLLPMWRNIFGVGRSEQCFAAVPMISTNGLGLGLVCRF
jgi:Membrane-associated phospholipid phosphatase